MQLTDKEFLEEYELEENEYFLKRKHKWLYNFRRGSCYEDTSTPKVGYMTKPNKSGSIPKAFREWNADEDVYIIIEEYRKGWKIINTRSATMGGVTWIELLHPQNFTVEVRTNEFFELLKSMKMENGLILNECFYEAQSKILKVKELK